ncbi:GTPase Era [Proteiniclasticum sp. BAD-10]|uniref:GTPase Era n=1 Tax=Proteiniclasticum sediminis TaxID=2804028 RepID=A0A941HQP1_9CLOT|nr:GTPase Era [Proteiniclasticum sediminis]MBR0576626.1 GTPase Era [Proteiniclasticum sediminis]
MFKSGFVTVVGRPNVGKSTFINHLMGEKLSIVSNKPQTTRKNLNAIYTDDEAQIIFVDTPGIHKAQNKLGEYMVSVAKESLNQVDLVIFITTASGAVHPGDVKIMEELKELKTPIFLLVNKIDEFDQDKVAKTLEAYGQMVDFKEIFPISALKGKNTENLLNLMKSYLPEGPLYYPADMVADVHLRFMVAESIREKALKLLQQEIPHGIAVEVTSMKEKDNGNWTIEADIICEKDSHKGIIIGKGGQTLKKIGIWAREDMEKYLDGKVELKTFVKVRKEWRDNPNLLKELGYKD